MRKIGFLLGALCLVGCQSNREYVFHEEYIEKNRWSQEDGCVKNYKTTTATVEWKN